MKKQIFTFVLLFATVVSYKVYDRQNRLIEIWQDRGEVIDVYDSENARKGFIKKERNQWSRYDKEWSREATIERDSKGEITLDRIER